MKTYIYRMKKEMYLALTRQQGRRTMTHQQLIDYVNDTFHLCVPISDVQTY